LNHLNIEVEILNHRWIRSMEVSSIRIREALAFTLGISYLLMLHEHTNR